MSFTAEQLATPFGRLATAIYDPDPPNPAGVQALRRVLELALAHGVTNGLAIDAQTRDWTEYDDATRTLSGATYWTSGAGVVLGAFCIRADGSYAVDADSAVAEVAIFQDPDWAPTIDDGPGQGSIAFTVRAIDAGGCRAVIDGGLLQ